MRCLILALGLFVMGLNACATVTGSLAAPAAESPNLQSGQLFVAPQARCGLKEIAVSDSGFRFDLTSADWCELFRDLSLDPTAPSFSLILANQRTAAIVSVMVLKPLQVSGRDPTEIAAIMLANHTKDTVNGSLVAARSGLAAWFDFDYSNPRLPFQGRVVVLRVYGRPDVTLMVTGIWPKAYADAAASEFDGIISTISGVE